MENKSVYAIIVIEKLDKNYWWKSLDTTYRLTIKQLKPTKFLSQQMRDNVFLYFI